MLKKLAVIALSLASLLPQYGIADFRSLGSLSAIQKAPNKSCAYRIKYKVTDSEMALNVESFLVGTSAFTNPGGGIGSPSNGSSSVATYTFYAPLRGSNGTTIAKSQPNSSALTDAKNWTADTGYLTYILRPKTSKVAASTSVIFGTQGTGLALTNLKDFTLEQDCGKKR